MKKIITIAIMLLTLSVTLGAQDKKDNQQTTHVTVTAPADQQSQTICSSEGGARFEIVTSGISGNKRYRLDKETGEVWIFYGNSNYKVIEREAAAGDDAFENANNYQLYLMGDGSNAYLVNLNTGLIWYYESHLFKDDMLRLMRPQK